MSHIKLKSAGEEPTVILHRALAGKGRWISSSEWNPDMSDRTVPSVGPGLRLPAIYADGHPCLEPPAQQLGSLVLYSHPLSLFSVTVSCQIIVRWQTAHLPSTKASGFRTEAEMNIIMGARSRQTTYQARKQLISVVSGFHGGGPGVHFLDRQV